MAVGPHRRVKALELNKYAPILFGACGIVEDKRRN